MFVQKVISSTFFATHEALASVIHDIGVDLGGFFLNFFLILFIWSTPKVVLQNFEKSSNIANIWQKMKKSLVHSSTCLKNPKPKPKFLVPDPSLIVCVRKNDAIFMQ